LDVIGKKVFRVFLLAIQSPLLTDFTPLPLEQKWSETVCNVNNVYGNLKSENSPEYACPETSTKLYVHEFSFRKNRNGKANAVNAADCSLYLFMHEFQTLNFNPRNSGPISPNISALK
jgi:hypothetical protein